MTRIKLPPLILECQHCKKSMLVPVYKLKHGQGKFCSISCKSKANIHKIHAMRTPKWTEDFKKRVAKWHEQMRSDPTVCYQWKGDKASYHTKHQWINRHYGKPKKCESCGISDPSKWYHWANISGKHVRNRSDYYKRLCVPCHSKYDMNRNPDDGRRKRECVRA